MEKLSRKIEPGTRSQEPGFPQSVQMEFREWWDAVCRILFVLLLISICVVPAASQTSRLTHSAELRERVRKIYTSQIGVRERASNAGLDVEKYLRYVNLSKGNPWCAAFVCWVFGKAGVTNPRSGWSPDLFGVGKVIWERGERGKLLRVSGIKYQESRYVATKSDGLPPSSVDGISAASRCAYPPLAGAGGGSSAQETVCPNTGDVFGIYFPKKGRIAHVGFIDQWDGTWLVSVEGNTNVSGSPEGDGVYRKRRLVKSIYRVARYIE